MRSLKNNAIRITWLIALVAGAALVIDHVAVHDCVAHLAPIDHGMWGLILLAGATIFAPLYWRFKR